MYTVDDTKNEYDDEEYQNNSYWGSNRELIIKIIIIILCVIVLVWLIIALRKNNKNNEIVYDPNVHNANVLKVRKAAEKYFFTDRLPGDKLTNKVTLTTLINNNLTSEIVDANNKVCNDNNSYATLTNEVSSYVLRINLACSTNEKEEIFFYNKNTYLCLNCEDSKNMDTNDDSKEEDDFNYSCKAWSDWQEERVYNDLLEERTRVLVRGVKKGETKMEAVYGEWSEFDKTPIEEREGIEIETEVRVEKDWGEDQTSYSYITDSETIKVVGVNTIYTGGGSYSYCPDGFKKDNNRCISDRTTGNLNYIQYNSSDYIIYNKPCNDVRVIKNSNGKYEKTYIGCQYSTITGMKTKSSGGSSQTIYTYKELVDTEVTYYRFRTVSNEEIKEEDTYTEGYYEENMLPSGYEKIRGSEKTEYSYKIAVCEK